MCTCMKPWMSILPPPPCPVHSLWSAGRPAPIIITIESPDRRHGTFVEIAGNDESYVWQPISYEI